MQEQSIIEKTTEKKPYEAPAVIMLAEVTDTEANSNAGGDFTFLS